MGEYQRKENFIGFFVSVGILLLFKPACAIYNQVTALPVMDSITGRKADRKREAEDKIIVISKS